MLWLEPIQRVQDVLADLNCSWYICGGWALDLFLGRPTRPHKDVDVALARDDQTIAREYLRYRGWELAVAEGGVLTPWEGDWLALPVHCVWCRNESCDPSFLELLLNEIDDAELRFRRDLAIRLPRDRMSFVASCGVTVLAPEVVLLYKASSASANTGDFENTVTRLGGDARLWLKDALRRLYSSHPWEGRL